MEYEEEKYEKGEWVRENNTYLLVGTTKPPYQTVVCVRGPKAEEQDRSLSPCVHHISFVKIGEGIKQEFSPILLNLEFMQSLYY